MKWVIIILVVIVGYAIITGNMGGAKDAAGNYNKIMRGGEK
jgi:heme A synthase